MGIKCNLKVSIADILDYEEEVSVEMYELSQIESGVVPERLMKQVRDKVNLDVKVSLQEGLTKFNLFKDEKVTVWERTFYSIVAKTKEEAVQSIIDEDVDCDESEMLYDTLEPMSIEDNDGYTTMEIREIVDEKEVVLYDNAVKPGEPV